MPFTSSSQPGVKSGLQCHGCNSSKKEVLQCSRCKQVVYCSRECQVTHWKVHKIICKKAAKGHHTLVPEVIEEKPWWVDLQRKTLRDGSHHEGKLELITWESTEEGYKLGFGAVVMEEAEELRKKFEVEMGGDLRKFYNYRSLAFRWTCCGAQGGKTAGCDHHGRGSEPCKCDFCNMGKAIPDWIYRPLINGPGGKGLDLPRGPDPRSFNPAGAAMAVLGRAMLGLQVDDPK